MRQLQQMAAASRPVADGGGSSEGGADASRPGPAEPGWQAAVRAAARSEVGGAVEALLQAQVRGFEQEAGGVRGIACLGTSCAV